MAFLHGLLTVLVTIALYSTGTTLGSKGQKTVPSVVDLVVLVSICVAAISARHSVEPRAFYPLWLVGVPLIGALASLWPKGMPPTAKKSNTVSPTGFLQRTKSGWLTFSHQAGGYSSRVMLAGFYFVVVTPYGLAIRLLADPLRLRKPKSETMWVERPTTQKTLDEFRRQF